MNNIQVGSYVKMTKEFKKIMQDPCLTRGFHFEHGTEEDCIECSNDHIREFGNRVGKVTRVYDEFEDAEVNWLPGNLHYMYGLKCLELTELKAFI